MCRLRGCAVSQGQQHQDDILPLQSGGQMLLPGPQAHYLRVPGHSGFFSACDVSLIHKTLPKVDGIFFTLEIRQQNGEG